MGVQMNWQIRNFDRIPQTDSVSILLIIWKTNDKEVVYNDQN